MVMDKIVNAARDLTGPRGPPPPPGEHASIKLFYEGLRSNNNCYNWVEKPPAQIRETTRRNHSKVAIQAYKIKDHGSLNTVGGITPLKFHSLKIQSPFIIDACRTIFEEAGMLLPENEPIVFDDPFPQLYFTKNKIERLVKKYEPKSDTQEHLKLFVSLLKEVFGDTAARVSKLMAKNIMSFRDAWTLFPRGSIVYSEIHGQARLFKLSEITLGRSQQGCSFWKLSCDYVRFDGTKFGVSTENLEIPMYGGNCLITDLKVYPVRFCKEKDILERLEKRGEKVVEYQDVSYKEYAGIAVPAAGTGKRNVTERIIVDTISFGKHNSAIVVRPLFGEEILEAKAPPTFVQNDYDSEYSHANVQPIPAQTDGSQVDGSVQPDGLSHLKRPTEEESVANTTKIMKDPMLLALMSPMLPGFGLKTKEWLLFSVDYVSPISWDEEAFDHLVYSSEHKDLLLTFVKNHKDYGRQVDDVITGKGQGLVFLLSGPPGTGKTLTAEAIADRSRRPLYYLNVEELGTDPAKLGGVLAKVLALAIEWNAIVLLDEADVFLSRRSVNDLKRNELVSIFLRELEYFRGILFLTTNLLQTIDDAFRSRIHIHLLYPRLSFSSRLVLWRNFIARLSPPTNPYSASGGNNTRNSSSTEVNAVSTANIMGQALIQKDLEYLAEWDLNGREIKNVVKTVRTWCVCKNWEFDVRRLEVGITVTAPFAVRIGRGDEGRVEEVA